MKPGLRNSHRKPPAVPVSKTNAALSKKDEKILFSPSHFSHFERLEIGRVTIWPDTYWGVSPSCCKNACQSFGMPELVPELFPDGCPLAASGIRVGARACGLRHLSREGQRCAAIGGRGRSTCLRPNHGARSERGGVRHVHARSAALGGRDGPASTGRAGQGRVRGARVPAGHHRFRFVRRRRKSTPALLTANRRPRRGH